MRSLGALVAGIGSYQLDPSVFPRLEFAAADAAQFADYLRVCWPDDDDAQVVHVSEEDATLEGLVDGFQALQQLGPFDLCLVFLSGHGLASDAAGASGLIVQPSSTDGIAELLDAARLDGLLASIQATRTILIIDCCYAEAVVRDMAYFKDLGQSDARLFIASSRSHQRTWEDDGLGHGIFTAHLLDLLRTGDAAKLKRAQDRLSVDGELFPVLCEQVPLYVFEHKAQQQEPVKGGVSIRGVSLPVAAAARRIRERSPFATAMRRTRQILFSVGVVVLAFLAAAYNFLYYAEADGDGQIKLRHGTRWLAPVFRAFPTTVLETGMNVSELSSKSSESYAVQAGQASGIWTQNSRLGYRAWYDVVRASLDGEAAKRYDVLLGIPPDFVAFLDETSQTSDVVRAGWAQLDSYDPQQLAEVIKRVPGPDDARKPLKKFDPQEMDFQILDKSPNELSEFADVLRYAAAVEPDLAFDGYVGFVQACTMWLAHSSPEQHGREVQRRVSEEVGDVFATIVRGRLDRGEPPLSSPMQSTLDTLRGFGYGRLIDLSLVRAGLGATTSREVVQAALARFPGYADTQDEIVALQTLVGSLDGSAASQELVDQVYKKFVSVGGAEQSDLTAFLIRAADLKSLSPPLVTSLVVKAREAVSSQADSFIDSEYARILAHGMSQVPPDSRAVVYELVHAVSLKRPPMSTAMAEIYTCLARQGFETPEMVGQIIERAAKAEVPQRGGNLVQEPLAGLEIVVGPGPWLQALAALGTRRDLPRDGVAVLEAHGLDDAVKKTVWRALARQSSWKNPACFQGACAGYLTRFALHGERRQLVVRVLAEQLGALPRKDFEDALARLASERLAETEPEIRIAIGQIRVLAEQVRVRTPELGAEFVE